MLEPAKQPKAPVATQAPLSGVPCLILGAGPTGLSAAYHYGAGSVVLEREAKVGGWCRSIEDTGFTFDHAGHIMFSDDPYVQDLYRLLLGDNVHWQEREAWIYSKGVYTRYPFQGALHGLPPDVLRECLVGAIEARFGALSRSGEASDAAAGVKDCCADATGIEAREALDASAAPPRNFEEFIHRTWGAGVAKHFAIPYNRKLWTVPLSEMETSWLGGRVPLPDLEEMIEGALQPVPKPMGPNARFGYPLRGGFQALMNGFLPLLRADLLLQANVERVSPLLRAVTLADGRRFHYDTLVSTLPLPVLIASMGDEAPAEIRRAASELRHVSIRCVNLGVARPHLSDRHWIYFPEDTVFHRVFLQGNASPHCNPPGGFGLTCEISYSPTKPLPAVGAALTERCVQDCIRVGLLDASDALLTSNQIDMPYAYVVYDHGRAERVAKIRAWLANFDIILAGRYSEWEYYNSDHAFIAGKKAAETAQRLAATRVAAKSA
jgi:UDP-galactopyranose mutase